MKAVDVVVCHAGEPTDWLHEIPATTGIFFYDTGVRQSKHRSEAVIHRRLGRAKSLPHESMAQRFGMGNHPMRSMIQARSQSRFQQADSLVKTAEEGITMRETSDYNLEYVKACAEYLLANGSRNLPARTKKIEVANDHHLRESSPWLQHIISYYDELAEVTVFVHGWPFDHVPDMVERIRSMGRLESWTLIPPTNDPKPIHEAEIRWQVVELLKFLGSDQDPDNTIWTIGTEFAATREVLQGHGKQFWFDLFDLAKTLGPRSAEAMERVYSAVLTRCAMGDLHPL